VRKSLTDARSFASQIASECVSGVSHVPQSQNLRSWQTDTLGHKIAHLPGTSLCSNTGNSTGCHPGSRWNLAWQSDAGAKIWARQRLLSTCL